jgi:hypothetical protein
METTTVKTQSGVTYCITENAMYWLGLAAKQGEMIGVFELLANHIAPDHRLVVWVIARSRRAANKS